MLWTDDTAGQVIQSETTSFCSISEFYHSFSRHILFKIILYLSYTINFNTSIRIFCVSVLSILRLSLALFDFLLLPM